MNDLRQMTGQGRQIEDRSFAVIDQEVGDHGHPPDHWQVVRRVIHSTADFEYKDLTAIHPHAVDAACEALGRGAPIVVDVAMISSGLSQERLTHFGCTVHGFIADPDVITTAKQKNSTRAIESMAKAQRLGLLEGAIIAIGNAPTALLEVARLIREEGVRPALVIGVPVGFVSAAESKVAIMDQGDFGVSLLNASRDRDLNHDKDHVPVPWIVTKGRKGGSTIAVAIIHALMYLAVDRQAKINSQIDLQKNPQRGPF